MILLIDSNETTTAPEVYSQLVEHFGNTVVPSELPHGDLAIPLPTGLLRIERKTVGDLAASIGDNRLFKQVDGMVKDSTFSAVIITGKIVYDKDDMLVANGRTTGWHGHSIRAALRSVQWAGCAIEFCAPQFYARTVEEMIQLLSKSEHRHYDVKNNGRAPVIDFYPEETVEQQHVEFIAGIPGIGPKLARSLLEWCGDWKLGEEVKLGTLAEALTWISLFPEMASSTIPEGWGFAKANRAKEFLGLSDGSVLEIRHNASVDEILDTLFREDNKHADG